NGVSRQNTILHGFLESLLNRRNVFPWDGSADDLVYKLQSGLSFVHRTDLNLDIRELTTATGLFLVNFTVNHAASNRFLIGNLRRTLVTFYFEFPAKTVYDNFQVKFTHSADHRLTGFGIAVHLKGRIFFRKLCQRNAQFIDIRLGFRLNSQPDHRFRKLDRFKHARRVLAAKRISGPDTPTAN